MLMYSFYSLLKRLAFTICSAALSFCKSGMNMNPNSPFPMVYFSDFMLISHHPK